MAEVVVVVGELVDSCCVGHFDENIADEGKNHYDQRIEDDEHEEILIGGDKGLEGAPNFRNK